MKRLTLYFFITLFCVAMKGQQYPFKDKSLPVEQRVADLLNRMTLEEKIDLLAGYNDFYLHPCERLGIPAFKMADGPLGLSSWGLWGRATAFPSALAVASSWNRELSSQLGEMYAQEWRARGIHFLLAPGVNIYRASKGARNFEYYGEDPYLTSNMVVPFIKAVQEGGVIATIKHFAGNDQEYDRYTVSTEVSDRALHEIYLAPFKAAVQKADVKAVMTGYNPLRGVYCTENKFLIDILKKDWGFDGMLMSDWACTYSADKAANHGLDLEMGSKSWFNKEKLLPLIEQGIVSEDVINDKVRRIYGTCMEMGFFDRPQKIDSIPVYNQKANRLSLKAAEEGIVLLKNSGVLPLSSPKSIAVIGPTANPPVINDRVFSTNGIVYGGGGSSRVHPWYVVNDLQGIENEFKGSQIYYHEGISNQFKRRLFRNCVFRTQDGKRGLKARYYSSGNSSDSSVSSNLIEEQAKAAGRVVNSLVSSSSEENTGNAIISRTDRNIDFEWWGTPDNNKNFGSDYEIKGSQIYYHEGISNQFKRRLFRNCVFRTQDGKRGLKARYYSSGNSSDSSVSSNLIEEQAKAAGRVVNSLVSSSSEENTGNAIISRTDRNIDFEWWGTPDNNKNFGSDYEIEWEGYIDVLKDDSIRFFVDAQGAYQLFVDDRLLVDASGSQSFHVSSEAVHATKGSSKHIKLKFWNQRSTPAEIRMGYCYDSDIDFSEAVNLASKVDAVIVCAGLGGSIELEGRDRPFDLPYGQDILIRKLSEVNPNTVVVMHAGGGVNMSSWIDNVSAVLHAFYPGQEGGNAVARIISGKVNPSAKLPFTIEKSWNDSPAAGNYDETRKEKKVYYNEGIFTGYRGYEKKNIKPLFPFGFGLSYTSFKYENLSVDVVDKKNNRVEVKFDITNTGNKAGAEIAQLYVTDVKSKEERPLKELKGFEKVSLNPNETKSVKIVLSEEDFQYYSEKGKKWILEKGEFIIKVGASSQDIRMEKRIRL